MGGDRVERIELFHVDVPFPSPLFPAWIPAYPIYRQRSTLLRVSTRAGLVGHATGIAFDREREGLGEFIGPFLVGLDPEDPVAAAERIRQSSFLGWRNAWMEIAFWDIAAQARGLPLWRLLAERLGAPDVVVPPRMDACASFPELRPPKVRTEAIDRAQSVGFRAAKLALTHHDPEEDRVLLEAVRSFVGDGFTLFAHAHRADSVPLAADGPEDGPARAELLAAFAAASRVEWLQGPLPMSEVEAQAALAAKSPVKIAGGDIAPGREALGRLVRRRAVSVLTPDPSVVGVDDILAVLAEAPDDVGFAPSAYGDGVDLLTSLHLLAAWGAARPGRPLWLELPWEPPAMLPELRDALLSDPLFAAPDGTVSPPPIAGLGAQVSENALRRYAQRFYTLTPVRFAVTTARRTGLRQTTAFAKRAPDDRRVAGSED